ncbi:DUF4157 domain-containing protein [Aggregatimonas sangjinii]|uniref:DUF4157 domain-containing protein n=1 Tax=Aggregatimonas sangjinii TaxID=2583587 RepID=A0A5B7SUK6_9FLAO|nr:DUF4157 domain-containing protein [Aggregatimonas sangjinii]QCX00969.1 DUF4157 domain-containing protein [Aggregatimonas sangjinii]
MKSKSFHRRRRVKRQKPAQKKAQNENFFEAQVQRKCEKCEDRDKQVQKKVHGTPAKGSKSFFGHYMSHIDAKGSTLSKQQRSFFEGRMGANFGDVKVHNDREAANAAKEIGAKAFTWQNHIVMNRAHFEAGSIEAKQLLAHELKHVQQQKNGRHLIQMMPEEEGAAPMKEAGEEETVQGKGDDTMADTEAAAMEKEAEMEETNILVPESVPEIQYIGRPTNKMVFGQSISIQGVTNATYDGGKGRSNGLQRTAVTEGPGCAEGDCWHYTGHYQIDYGVATSVSLPEVPSGLSPCQEDRVREAIANELVPHENDHVAAFEQYNGSVTLSIDYTGPSSGIEAYVQQLHDTDEAARRAASNAASTALDPFHVNIDLDCEEEPAAAPPAASEVPAVS